MKAKLTPEENRRWEMYFAAFVDEGDTDEAADQKTWELLQQEFPRLQEFEGCEAGNFVPSGFECPKCDEGNVDHLLINEDDEEAVTCLTCGHVYSLPTAEAEREGAE